MKTLIALLLISILWSGVTLSHAATGSAETGDVVVDTRGNSPLEEALDTPGWTWTTGGDAAWADQTQVTHDGVDAARSGSITDDEESWMETVVTGPGQLSFRWKVSSEADYDFLEFYINGELQSGGISGEVDWQQRTFVLGVGSHELRWRYVKDFSVSLGLDAGFVDQVSFLQDGGADLEDLFLSYTTLSPAFVPETTAYSAGVVSNATASLTVTPSAAHADASVAVRVNGGAYLPVVSGSASGALALNVGANLVEVRVTAEDGATKRVYAVEVFRRTYAPAPPQLFDPEGGTNLPQNPGGVNLSWAPEERANWHEVYLTRNGALYLRQWVTSEPEIDGEGNAVFHFNTAELPPGNYQWWVRSRAPVTGSGGWSAPGSFTVACESLNPPAMPGGQTEFEGHWPLALEIEGFETSATWAQFEVLQGSASFKQLWVSITERGRAASYDPETGAGDSGFTILPDGAYQWRARTWSSCHGNSEWSTPQELSISGTACTGSLAAPDPGQIDIGLDHTFSGAAGAGSTPVVAVSPGMVPPATWYQLWIGPAGGGGAVLSKWYRYADIYDPSGGAGGSYRLEAGQYLAAGSYLAYVRGYNACGYGAWSAAMPFAVEAPASLEVTGLDVAFDGDGALRALWNGLPGVDWYQVWINSDGTNVFNRWFDGGSGGGGYLEWFDGSGQAEFRGPEGSAVHAPGSYAFWVRTYLAGGAYGPWVSATGTSPVDLLAVPELEPTVEIEDGRPEIRWNAATVAGGYEIYLSRNGSLYHRESLLPEDLVWDETSRTWTGSPPTEYGPYWEPEPGSYRAWVRVQGGTRFGPWSAPVDFVLP